MKKLCIAIAAVFALAGPAKAGDYHHGDELKCQQCHTMHSQRTHDFEIVDAGGAILTPALKTYTPSPKLLVSGDTNLTCLSCHNRGGTSGYDVFGAGGSLDGLRSAGALNGVNPPSGVTYPVAGNVKVGPDGKAWTYQPQMGHTMGSTATAPGGTFSNALGFDCGDCHEIHGSTAFRNLGPMYGTESGFAFTEAEQPTYRIDATLAASPENLAVDVVESASEMNETVGVKFFSGGGANRMNAYCAKCHGNFHGNEDTDTAAAGVFKRHPTGNAAAANDISATDGRYTANNVVRPVWTAADRVSPGCLSCHKAHGNGRAYALVIPVQGTDNVNTEQGDEIGHLDHTGTKTLYNPKTLCTTCHYQGKH